MCCWVLKPDSLKSGRFENLPPPKKMTHLFVYILLKRSTTILLNLDCYVVTSLRSNFKK